MAEAAEKLDNFDLPSTEDILLVYDLGAPDIVQRLQSYGYKFKAKSTPDEIEAMPEEHLKVAFVGVTPGFSKEFPEAAQKIRAKFPDVKVVGILQSHSKVHSRVIYNLGADYVFQLPFEEELVVNLVFERAPVEVPGDKLSLETMLRVNIVDLARKEPLPFDIYVCLPANKKVLKYRSKGHAIDEKTIKKFKDIERYHLYIRKCDISSYHKYCADVLAEIKDDKSLDGRVKKKKLNKEISNLMQGFFSEEPMEEGDQKQLVENVKQIVDQLVDQQGSKKEVKESVSKLAAEHMTNYSHSRNVATFCGLFGMVLGYNEPETLNMGGLLHDIGLSDLPSSIIGKELEDMEEDEQSQYKLHPGNAKFNISAKKLKLPERAMNMVVQHHEHTDGSGYPYGLKGDEIDPFAKVCAFADQFDKLTSLRLGHNQLTPVDAVRRIAGLDGGKPLGIYDPDFHEPLVNFILNTEGENQSLEELGKENAALLEDIRKKKELAKHRGTAEQRSDVRPEAAADAEAAAVNAGEKVGDLTLAPVEADNAAGGGAKGPIESPTEAEEDHVPHALSEIDDVLDDLMDDDLEDENVIAALGIDEEIATVGGGAGEDEESIGVKGGAVTGEEDISVKGSAGEDEESIGVKGGAVTGEEDINVKGSAGEDEESIGVKGGAVTGEEDISVKGSAGEDEESIGVKGGAVTGEEDISVRGSAGEDEESVGVKGGAVTGEEDISVKGSAGEDEESVGVKGGAVTGEEDISVKGSTSDDDEVIGATPVEGKADGESAAGSTTNLEELNSEIEGLDIEAFQNSGGLDDPSGGGSSKSKNQNEKEKKKTLDVKARNRVGQTILMQMAAQGRVGVAERLLEMGAEVDAKDFNGFTSLMFSIRKGHIDMVEMLLNKRSKPNIKDSKGRNCIAHAVEVGRADIIRMLVAKGGRADIKIKGSTVLMIAAFLGNIDVVKALIEGGADKKAKDIKGQTAERYAASKGHAEVAALLKIK